MTPAASPFQYWRAVAPNNAWTAFLALMHSYAMSLFEANDVHTVFAFALVPQLRVARPAGPSAVDAAAALRRAGEALRSPGG